MTSSMISMKLGENQLVLNDEFVWVTKTSDLEEAEMEIDALLEERQALASALEAERARVLLMRNELVSVENAKTVALDMLQEEREVRLRLEKEVEGYKQELRKSYECFIGLKKMVAGPGHRTSSS
jgi:hypothetical protein